MDFWTVGQLVQVQAQFLDVNGFPADPTTVTLTWQFDNATPTVLTYGASTIVRTGAGAYNYNIDTTGLTKGFVSYVWAGTDNGSGGVTGIKQGIFGVEPVQTISPTALRIIHRVQTILQDLPIPFYEVINPDGVNTVYELDSVSISSKADFTIKTITGGQMSPGQYTVNYKQGMLSFYEPPIAGSPLLILGQHNEYFTDDEILQFVYDAFDLHVADQEPLPRLDPLPGEPFLPRHEEYLVSILAAVEALWVRATDSAQQINVQLAYDVTIPINQRYTQIINLIGQLEAAYKERSQTLGVGLWRVQVLNQRRVSKDTNRLVPIFREQEFNAPYNGFFPTAAPVGAWVTINGANFWGTTAVAFGGIPAQKFTVVNDRQIKACVPTGAQTGQIGITTPTGVVLSTAQFVVGQPAPQIDYGPEWVKLPIPPGR